MWGKRQKISVQLLSSPPFRGGRCSNTGNRSEEADIIVEKIEKYELEGEKVGAEMLGEGAQCVNVTTNLVEKTRFGSEG